MDIRELGKIVLREFCKKWGTSDNEVLTGIAFGKIPDAKQMHVDCLLDPQDCRKAAGALARAVPQGVRFGQLTIPFGVEGVVVDANNVSLRILTMYDQREDRHIVRIDALFV